MNSVICTLFEGDYSYGVGALTNSLYAQGFRGAIYVGYRGSLPPWFNGSPANGKPAECSPADGIVLRFIPIATHSHLTNYKPDFMLDLWQNHSPTAGAIFYFDPDIVVKCRWAFFEQWVAAGVAVCADINPSMPANHPMRYAWKQFIATRGLPARREPDTYYNGGFVGLKSADKNFLHRWRQIQQWMEPEIGGLQNTNVGDGCTLFHKTDQDALNIAIMASETLISPLGVTGMDFQPGGGGSIMSHAAGGRKPWQKNFVRNIVLKGRAPSRADKAYFQNVEEPIQLYSPAQRAVKETDLKLAALLGRFLGTQL